MNDQDKDFYLNHLKYNQISLVMLRGYEVPEDEKVYYQELTREIEEGIYGEGSSNTEIVLDKVYEKIVDGITFTLTVRYIIPEGGSKVSNNDIDLSDVEVGRKEDTFLFIAPKFSESNLSIFSEASRNTEARIEAWAFEELLVNPFTHYSTPPQKILTESEIKTELPKVFDKATKKIFLSQMKGMINDIAAKWLGAKIGDIIRSDAYNPMLNSIVPEYRLVRR